MYVILLQYVKPLTVIETLLSEHRAFLDHHYAAGHFLLSGAQDPRTGGVIIAHNLTRTALDAVLEEDPFKREGAAEYRVITFHPVKAAPELAGLLSS